MDPEFWHNKWQKNDIAFDQATPNEHLIEFFPKIKLKKGSSVFVPLCGKTIDMLWLIKQGYHVKGVELSEVACQQFFEQHQLSYAVSQQYEFKLFKSEQVTLFAGDFFKMTQEMLGDLHAIYDRAALIALSEALRFEYVQQLVNLVKQPVPILLISSSYNQSEMDGPPFSIPESEVNRLFSKKCAIQKILDRDASALPPHLVERGLRSASEQVYIINLASQ